MKRYLIIGFIALASVFATKAQIPIQFLAADSAYAQAQYQKAIELYQAGLSEIQEDPTAEIFYNLGCAYYKAGIIPYAILNFERSLRLKPGDKNTLFNLRLARSKTVDKMPSKDGNFVSRKFDKIANSKSISTWMSLGILLFIFFGISLLYFFFFAEEVRWRKISFSAALIFLLLSILFNILLARNYTNSHDTSYAILTASSLTLKSSPDESSENLAVLHGGIRVKMLQTLNSYTEVKLPNGAQGWVKSDDLESILPFKKQRNQPSLQTETK